MIQVAHFQRSEIWTFTDVYWFLHFPSHDSIAPHSLTNSTRLVCLIPKGHCRSSISLTSSCSGEQYSTHHLTAGCQQEKELAVACSWMREGSGTWDQINWAKIMRNEKESMWENAPPCCAFSIRVLKGRLCSLGWCQGSTREGAGSGNVGTAGSGRLLSSIYPGTAAALKHWGQVRRGQGRQGAAGPVA